MHRLSYPTETFLSKKITGNKIVPSFKDCPNIRTVIYRNQSSLPYNFKIILIPQLLKAVSSSVFVACVNSASNSSLPQRVMGSQS